MSSRIAIWFFSIFFCTQIFAQENYIFQHLTVDDGLFANSGAKVFQDSEGFYWFTSSTGMQQYDGQNFINYTFKYKNNKSLTTDWTSQAIEDKEKNIWVVNGAGINIFLRKERLFKRLYLSDAADSNVENLAGIIKDTSNGMWIITAENIFRYDYKSQALLLYAHVVNNNTPIYTTQYDFKNNGFWCIIAGVTKRIAFFDLIKRKLIYPDIASVGEMLGQNSPISFFKMDSDGNLWIASYIGDFCKYNTLTGKITHYSILHEKAREKIGGPNSSIFDFLEIGNRYILFGGDNYLGLLQYDKKTDQFSGIPANNGLGFGLHFNETIFNFFADRDNNIWISTDLGFNVFNPSRQQFKYIYNRQSPLINSNSENVSSFFESINGNIWITTWGDGLFKYNSQLKLQKIFVHDKNKPYSLGEPLNRTWCVEEDDRGRIWIGSQYAMLSILDTITGKFFNKVIPGFNRRTIMYMQKDTNNDIWMGLFNGTIAKWDSKPDSIIVYKNLYGKDSIKNIILQNLYLDKNDLWIAINYRGLNRFNKENQCITETDLINNQIYSLNNLNDSIIMGGTSGSGLFLFNKFTKKAQFFNTANGLSSNNIYGGIADNNKNIWIFSEHDIEKMNAKTGKISRFNISDGIKDHDFLRAFYKIRNGMILVAGKSGVIYFNPDSIKTKPAPHDVVITGFYANQYDLSVDSLLQLKRINLPYNKNVIKIQYASLSFSSAKSDQYFYQLVGVDKDWISATTARSVTYANLTPGEYIFKVKAQNEDGLPTKDITTIGFIIHPPWWRTWWAYLLWFLIGASIVYAVYDYRKQNRKALSDVRQKIASDLHDEIGSTLNSISVYSEVATQQVETNTQNAKSILQKMGSASRNMIDTMNDIVWSINPVNDQFENILQRMQYFAGELLSGKNILLQFEAQEEVKDIRLPMVKRKDFYLIFKEAVTNAYKYSSAKNVNVSIGMESGKLIMIISDDGAGFESTDYTLGGNGLINMQTRAKEINAQLHIKSWPQKGTRIELKMDV